MLCFVLLVLGSRRFDDAVVCAIMCARCVDGGLRATVGVAVASAVLFAGREVNFLKSTSTTRVDSVHSRRLMLLVETATVTQAQLAQQQRRR